MSLLPMDMEILPPSDEMASSLLMSVSKDEQERAIFRSRRKYQTDRQSDLATAEDRGVQKGRTEREIEFARYMIADGEPTEKIMRYTGLSLDEIERLRSAY